MKQIQLPESLKNIGQYAFKACTALEKLRIPSKVEKIKILAFEDCNKITQLNYDAERADMNYNPGYYEANRSVFRGCSMLQSIYFGKSVKQLDDYAFYEVPVTTVHTENTIERVGYKAFYGTPWMGLQKDHLIYIDHAAYLYRNETNIDPLEINLKEGTRSITQEAFANNPDLVKITIPRSLQNIEKMAFYNCNALGEVVWNADSVADMKEASPFSTALATITFGNHVRYLPAKLLENCSGLEELKLPESLIEIGNETFEDCKGLKELILPNSLQKIGRNSLYGLENLTRMVFGEGLKELPNEDYMLGRSNKLDSVEWNAIELIHYDWDSYHPNNRSISCNIKKLIVGDKVKYIPSGLCYDNPDLTQVVLGKSVTEIGQAVFRNCSGLKSVDLPDNLELIGKYAFMDTGLEEVYLPKKVKTINTWAYANCKQLKKVIVTADSVPRNGNAFPWVNSGIDIYVNDSINYYKEWGMSAQMFKPMVKETGPNTLVYNGKMPTPNFIGNLPGYQLTSLASPSLSADAGSHKATMRAEFKGDRSFAIDVAWHYVILKAQQSIQWDQDFEHLYTEDSIKITATTTSGLPLSNVRTTDYRNTYSEVVQHADGSFWLICKKPGSFDIIAEQQGNNNWLEAPRVFKKVVITEASGIEHTTIADSPNIHYTQKSLVIKGTKKGETITIYTADGKLMSKNVCTDVCTSIPIHYNGILLVQINTNIYKVLAQ